ncbi:iron ABC transporter substrate-binding protein [Lampropedia puyangensis]|uniref:Iron ABC transporter substrate-binding protein n=1 Tax=Lampropedia puyangensis TaxID=1330072 RepID=A0A4V4GSF4_9BURK|nr:ABC transporter substrate-binding protein [Lampropedia puyangensis]THU04546.1 iron ABC transporter substrate-binding protein [Lampropedia puyangensis]
MQRRDFLHATLAAALAAYTAPAAWARESKRAPLFEIFGHLRSEPARVFVAGPPAAVLVAALAPEKLLGWPSRMSDQARVMLSAPLAALPTVGRLGGRGSSISTEALLALRPDVIVDVGSIDDYYRSQAQRTAQQTGIPYILVDGRLPETAEQLRQLGAELGVSERAQPLAAYAQQTLQQAQALRTQWQQQPPRVYLARSADGLETGWQGSINAELLEYLGAQNVAATHAQTGEGGTGPAGNVGRVSFEQLLAWNPDLIVTQEAGLAQRLRATPLWRSIKAVQTGQVLQAPHVPFGWLDAPPGPNRLMGLRWLTLALQDWRASPSSAASETLQAQIEHEAQTFYQLFYGMRNGAQWPAGALPWA